MISINTKKWYEGMLRKAALLGQLSDMPKHKIGAILVHKKSIVSTGYNKRKSHPLQYQFNQYRQSHKRKANFVHAEVDCLGSLREVPRGSILFVGRLDLNGNPALCRPCEACSHLIKLHGITEIVYNTEDGYAIEYLEKGVKDESIGKT
jgi:deoxycytidylate deaminase